MFTDAHVHLQEPAIRELGLSPKDLYGVEDDLKAVVNGTCLEDWDAVKELYVEFPHEIRVSLGVHPWKVNECCFETAMAQLRGELEMTDCLIGEIGLDRWVEPKNESLQSKFLRAQWELAQEFKRVTTVHCLKADQWLQEELKLLPQLATGWLMHGFGGSQESAKVFLDQGAYFSFSAYALSSHRKRMHSLLSYIPEDRILVETDAPAMPPDSQFTEKEWTDSQTGERLNHLANLRLAYREIARIRGLEESAFIEQVSKNFQRLFASKG